MRKRLLVAYSCGSTFVSTTLQYISAFKRYSDWDVSYVHVTDQAHMDFDFDAYDALFHNYCARLCFPGYVSPSYIEAARRFRGVKVMAVQDEYDFTNIMRTAAADLGFDIILTCVPEDRWERVYPRTLFPNTALMRVLTGYVPDDLEARGRTAKPLSERATLLSYRGRDIGGRYGRLAFDKLEIGRKMREICTARGLPVDIDWSEESRIYGDPWFDFLGSCRATLATESGSDIFDFDGRIAKAYATLTQRLGHAPSYFEFEPQIREIEGQIAMGQVSPRVFEAAAMHTPLVMFEGSYSDVVSPDVHYIALRKDFSNVDEVLRRLDDLPALEAMAERAHRDLVASGVYSYRSFATRVMDAIERHHAAKGTTRRDVPVPQSTRDRFVETLTTAALLNERPTPEPLSTHWYRIAAACRVIGAVRDGGPKLLAWAHRELARETESVRATKAAAMAQIEQGLAGTDQACVARLNAANASGDAGQITDAIAIGRQAYEAVQSDIVATVLNGRSALRSAIGVLRAPWVSGDVPRLRTANQLKERMNTPAVQRARQLAKRLASRSTGPA